MRNVRSKRGRSKNRFVIQLVLMTALAIFLGVVLLWDAIIVEMDGGMAKGSMNRGKQIGLLEGRQVGAKVDKILPVSGTISLDGVSGTVTDGMLLADGRLFLEEGLTRSLLGAEAAEKTDESARTIPDKMEEKLQDIHLNEKIYISINHISRRWRLWPIFSDQGVNLCRSKSVWDIGGAAGGDGRIMRDGGAADSGAGMACLRLEDIMADASEDGRFTHEKLEKLRVLGRWLSDRGQEYSVAWIPLYTNPKTGIRNDLTRQFNWYNADFLYTLDSLVQDGGHIGLHGLTHQYGDTVSADGYEFGKDTPFSGQEVEERLQHAIDIAGRLGYSAEFFEFPHYGMTKRQAKLAEKYFTVIYQQELWTRPYGHIETKESEGRTVMYVPTPADCIQSEYDKEGMLARLELSREKGELVSLFFHPSLDFVRISCVTDGDGVRLLSYDEEGGIAAGILRQVEGWGLRFSIPWQKSDSNSRI